MNETKMNKPEENVGKKSKTPIIVGIVVALLFVIYGGGVFYFQNHFLPRTTVNGVKASYETVDAVMKGIDGEASGYSLTITDDEENETIISPEDIDLTVPDKKTELQEMLSSQSAFAWPLGFVAPETFESDVLVSFDEKKLDAVLAQLPAVKNKNVTVSQDASYSYDGDQFSIIPEVYGNEVDTKLLMASVSDCILNMQETLDLREANCYVQPEVLSTDEELVALVEKLNDGVNFTITYTLDDGTEEKLTPETIQTWLTTEDGKVAYDEELAREFVQEMATKYNTVGHSMTLTCGSGQEITVPGGNYGYRIDEDGEVEQLLADLEAGKDVSRDFVYSQTAMGGRSGPGNLYFEVNKTAQKIYVVKDGQVVLESACITGIPMNGHDTHVGCWYLNQVQEQRVLNGMNDDGTEYHTKVNYWMHFYNGEGFHDATWQSAWGGSTYLVKGSHGCVNLPLSVARELYSYASVGVPVYVYELPGTETGDATTRAANMMNLQIKKNLAVLAAPSLEHDATLRTLWAQWNSLTPDAQLRVSNAGYLIAAHDAINAQRLAAGLPTD